MHSLFVGQEIEAGDPLSEKTWETLHAPAPPVGFVEVATLPAVSTAAQKLVVGQEIPVA